MYPHEQVEQVAKPVPEVVKAAKVIEVAEPEKVSSNYHDQKAKDALTRFADAVKAGIRSSPDGFLKWKRSTIEKATGITAQTWRSQSEKVDELLDAGLEIVEVAGRQKGRTQTIVKLAA